MKYDHSKNDSFISASFGAVIGISSFLLNFTPSIFTTLIFIGITTALCYLTLQSLPPMSAAALDRAEAKIMRDFYARSAESGARLTTSWTTIQVPAVDNPDVLEEAHVHALHLRHHPTWEPTDADKPTIVLLHGHSSQHGHWACILHKLTHELGIDVDVHIIDLPGWGRSAAPASWSKLRKPSAILQSHSQLLHAWCTQQGLSQIILVGHSLGGMLATHFSGMYPGLVQHVTLIAPCGVFPYLTDGWSWTLMMHWFNPQRYARWFGRLGFVPFRVFYNMVPEDSRYTDYYYLLAGATAWTGKADTLFGNFLEHHWGACCRRGRWRKPMIDTLARIPQHLTIIWGEHDEMFPAEFAHLIQRVRPDSDVFIIKEGLHNPAHYNARAVAAAIGDAVCKALEQPRPLLAAAGIPMVQVLQKRRASLALPADASSEAVATQVAPKSTEIAAATSAARRARSCSFTVGGNAGHPAMRGKCNDCQQRVQLSEGCWACTCGEWSFSFWADKQRSELDLQAMGQFLRRCYRDGTFAAKSDGSIPQHAWLPPSTRERTDSTSLPRRPSSGAEGSGSHYRKLSIPSYEPGYSIVLS